MTAAPFHLPPTLPHRQAQDSLRRRPDPLDASSVRAVGRMLAQGRMTAMQLRDASGLPRRTIYRALFLLREAGLVQQRRSLQDSRQSYFWLVAAAAQAAHPSVSGPVESVPATARADEPATHSA